ncbi:MAG: carboxypeptidase-like regulatory domain-containing protein, partial [Bacteroidota bacterium]
IMSEETKHINYSAADIEKYHRGELSPAAMHAMEKAALDDPFLADAMEGYEVYGNQRPASIQNEVNDLQKRLATRVDEENKAAPVIKFAWWKVAAAVLLFIGAGWIYTSINNKSKQQNIAKTEDVKKESPAPTFVKTDSTKSSVNTDTAIVAGDLAVTEKKQTVKDRNRNPVISTGRSVVDRNKAVDHSSSVAAAPAVADKKEALEKSAGKTEAEIRKDIASPLVKSDTLSSGRQNRLRSEDSRPLMATTDKKQKMAPALSKQAPGISTSDDKTFYSPLAGSTNNLSNTFNGQIVDQSNQPIANALVQIPNLNIATQTNDKGYFSFKSKDTSLTVSIASVGFETQNLELTTNSIEDDHNVIRLKPSLINLNEVVVGYGTKKKNALTQTKDVTIRILDAEPVAGWNEYNHYLEKNKKVPGEMRDVHGEVIISFTVNSKGSLGNFNVNKSLIGQLDNEVIRLIKEGPPWKLLKGKKAKASVTLKF